MKKQLLLLTSILMCICIFTSCKKENETPPDETEIVQNTNSNLAQYEKYFYAEAENTPPTKLGFITSNSWSHILSYNTTEINEASKTLVYDGIISDSSIQYDHNTIPSFTAKYILDNNQVVESIHMNDTYPAYKPHLLSIIDNFIVLQGEIQENKTWDQTFTYNGEEHTAKTSIIETDDKLFCTKTTVYGLYEDEATEYAEIRVYYEGYGLIYFHSSVPAEVSNSSEINLTSGLKYLMSGDTMDEFNLKDILDNINDIVHLSDIDKSNNNNTNTNNNQNDKDDDYVDSDHNTSTEDGEVWYSDEEGE